MVVRRVTVDTPSDYNYEVDLLVTALGFDDGFLFVGGLSSVNDSIKAPGSTLS